MADLDQLCTRDGELSELTLFRHLNGELDAAERQAVESRLADSPRDRARLEELQAFSEGLSVQPPASVSGGEIVAGPWSRTTKVVAAVVLLAAVVVLAIVGTRALDETSSEGREGPIAAADTDGIRSKGSSFDLRVQVQRDSTQWLGSGDVVVPGETVQFVAYPREEGYLLVVGVDAERSVYPCHPTAGGPAAAVEPVAGEMLLEGGLTFDDVLGSEHIIGLFCPEPFSFDEVSGVGSRRLLDGWTPSEQCRRTELRLVKESP